MSVQAPQSPSGHSTRLQAVHGRTSRSSGSCGALGASGSVIKVGDLVQVRPDRGYSRIEGNIGLLVKEWIPGDATDDGLPHFQVRFIVNGIMYGFHIPGKHLKPLEESV